MDFRHKHLARVLRIVFGFGMLFSGVSFWFIDPSSVPQPPEILAAFEVLAATGIIQLIKVVETLAGLLLLVNVFPALAVILLAPIAVGLVVFSLFISPQTLVVGVVMCLFCAYFGYLYWDQYSVLFRR